MSVARACVCGCVCVCVCVGGGGTIGSEHTGFLTSESMSREQLEKRHTECFGWASLWNSLCCCMSLLPSHPPESVADPLTMVATKTQRQCESLVDDLQGEGQLVTPFFSSLDGGYRRPHGTVAVEHCECSQHCQLATGVSHSPLVVCALPWLLAVFSGGWWCFVPLECTKKGDGALYRC
jgi:hypothetical protein